MENAERMNITQNKIDYYNAKNNGSLFEMPSFNEEYNKVHGIPSRSEWSFMNGIHTDNFGIRRGKITMKMVKLVRN